MTDAQFMTISHALRDGLIPPGEVAVAVRAMMDEVRESRRKIAWLKMIDINQSNQLESLRTFRPHD